MSTLLDTLVATLRDVVPIIVILLGFQRWVLRTPVANMRRVATGMALVVIGLALFLQGLETALFPVGKLMAEQLTAPAFVGDTGSWGAYMWVYVFAAAIGFATTIAEPALIAVAIKASNVSGGAIRVFGLRVAVAVGVAIGIALGTFRLVSGTPIEYYIMAGYIVVVVQTAFAPRAIIALAYDSGGVTTSTVTVPLVTALGLGLAHNVPGRSALIDGFGLIAFASLFPMITVMGYAQLGQWRARRAQRRRESGGAGETPPGTGHSQSEA